MATVSRISESELLDALALATKGNAPDAARTVAEIAELASVSRDLVLERLRSLNRRGLIAVHQVERTNLIGRTIKVPGYTVLPVKKRVHGKS